MILPNYWILLRTSSSFTRSSTYLQEPQEPQEDTHDPQFEPVIKLTEQVEAKTHEEDEEVLFKMSVLLSRR